MQLFDKSATMGPSAGPSELVGKVKSCVHTLRFLLFVWRLIPCTIAAKAPVPLEVAITALESSIFNNSLAFSSSSFAAQP